MQNCQNNRKTFHRNCFFIVHSKHKLHRRGRNIFTMTFWDSFVVPFTLSFAVSFAVLTSLHTAVDYLAVRFIFHIFQVNFMFFMSFSRFFTFFVLFLKIISFVIERSRRAQFTRTISHFKCRSFQISSCVVFRNS